jgi:hypothetical protein
MLDGLVEEFRDILANVVTEEQLPKGMDLAAGVEAQLAYDRFSKTALKDVTGGNTSPTQSKLLVVDEEYSGPLTFKNHDLYSFHIGIKDVKKPAIAVFAIDVNNRDNPSFATAIVGTYNMLNNPSWKTIKESMNKKYLELVSKIVK